MISWTLAFFLCLAATAATIFVCALTLPTPKRSPKSSNAGDAWRIEYDLELAELKSTVAGLSSTLRKLHGRESARAKREPESLATDNPTYKNELRQRFGILPRARDAD